MVGKSTTYKYHEHIGEVAETLAPHYIISIGVWFPEKTMEVSSTKPMSNKYIDQYSESTLTAVFKCKGFETQGLLPEMESASISLSPYNNMLIPLILQILVNIYYYIIHKIYTNNILRNISYTILYGTTRVTQFHIMSNTKQILQQNTIVTCNIFSNIQTVDIRDIICNICMECVSKRRNGP